jgi:ATP-binding cassette subfamily B protein
VKKIQLILRLGAELVRLCPIKVVGYLFSSYVSQTAIPLSLALLLGWLTDAIQPSQHGNGSHLYFGLVPTYAFWLALTLILIPSRILFRLAQTSMDNQMEQHVRQHLFDKIIRQAPEFFHRYNPGQLTNILTQTTIEAQQALRAIVVDPFLQITSLSSATLLIIVQLKQNYGHSTWWLIALIVLFGALSVAIVQAKGQKPVYESQRNLQERRFALSGLVDSAVKSPEEIQSMDAEDIFGQRYSAGLTALMGLKRRGVLMLELVNSAIGLPSDIIQAFVFGLVVYKIANGDKSFAPGVFVTLALLIPRLMDPFRSFASLGIIASSSWPAIELVSSLLAEPNRIRDLLGAKEINGLEPVLEVDDLTFRYAPELAKVFDGLSMIVPPAKITSLVARMGQGKTTFFRLALRFYEPEKGHIRLGGHPTRDFTIQSLRQNAAMMSQFPAFFHDTVRANFQLAKANASDREILDLCVQTGLMSILERALGTLPLGRDFAAGEMLSGGEKRLFALTRCLLRNPTFLFLDEPTTNMSNDEKYRLIPKMRAACLGRTVIVVDHDISWLLQFADHFVSLEGGRIVQQGSATELLSEAGLLRDLYALAYPAVGAYPNMTVDMMKKGVLE